MKHIYSEIALREAVKNSYSIYDVMRRLGIRLTGGSHSHISRRIKRIGLDISHFSGRAWNKGKVGPRKSAVSILIEYPKDHKRIAAYQLRRALIEKGVKEKCIECGVVDTYNERPIRLHVDHINGDFTDCREQNLRFLCPNCHSQTETFGRKQSDAIKIRNRKGRKERYLQTRPGQCKVCGISTKRNFQYCSYACSNIGHRKVERPSKEELIQMISETSYLAVARRYGVSDNAIRKWLR